MKTFGSLLIISYKSKRAVKIFMKEKKGKTRGGNIWMNDFEHEWKSAGLITFKISRWFKSWLRLKFNIIRFGCIFFFISLFLYLFLHIFLSRLCPHSRSIALNSMFFRLNWNCSLLQPSETSECVALEWIFSILNRLSNCHIELPFSVRFGPSHIVQRTSSNNRQLTGNSIFN